MCPLPSCPEAAPGWTLSRLTSISGPSTSWSGCEAWQHATAERLGVTSERSSARPAANRQGKVECALFRSVTAAGGIQARSASEEGALPCVEAGNLAGASGFDPWRLTGHAQAAASMRHYWIRARSGRSGKVQITSQAPRARAPRARPRGLTPPEKMLSGPQFQWCPVLRSSEIEIAPYNVNTPSSRPLKSAPPEITQSYLESPSSIGRRQADVRPVFGGDGPGLHGILLPAVPADARSGQPASDPAAGLPGQS
jgi:hypothetical protein